MKQSQWDKKWVGKQEPKGDSLARMGLPICRGMKSLNLWKTDPNGFTETVKGDGG